MACRVSSLELLSLCIVVACSRISGLQVQNKTTKILDGYVVDIVNYPFMVNIINKSRSSLCGGTLIAPKCVLTAAHCVDETPIHEFVLHAGSSFLNMNPIKQKVEATYKHPDYDPTSVDADIAIIKLRKPLQGKHIEIIQIDTKQLQKNDVITSLGWGKTELNDISKQLRAVNLTVMSQIECNWRHFGHITKNMFCAKGSRGKDSCDGDSGGPVIQNGKQVGIVSWGRGCGVERFPGVYTRLSSNKIENQIQNWISMYCI